jgi:hypothetical protein
VKGSRRGEAVERRRVLHTTEAPASRVSKYSE